MGPYTADQLETIFHAALETGDVKGVEAAIRVMVTVDPHRADDLWGELLLAVAVAKRLR